MKKRKILIAVATACIFVFIVLAYTGKYIIVPSMHYKKADALLQSGNSVEAALEFRKAGNYKDSVDRAGSLYYRKAELLLKEGDYYGASAAFGNAGTYYDALIRKYKVEHDYLYSGILSVGPHHIVGLNANGTVISTGVNDKGQCDTSDWKDIVAVATCNTHTLGLRSDGTVAFAGLKEYFDMSGLGSWNVSNVVAIAANNTRSIALISDGTVETLWFSHELNDAMSKWRDIVAVSVGLGHCVGLHSDGTVVAVGDDRGSCDVSSWQNIVAVAAGRDFTVGLHSDGTVIVAASKFDDFSNISTWQNIVAIEAGNCAIGIHKDGTVVTAGKWADDYDVSYWDDTVAAGTGDDNITGMTKDGKLYAYMKDTGPILWGLEINR